MVDPRYKNIGDPTIRIIEECGEIIQATSKGLRFGWKNNHPDNPELTNFDDLQKEIFDLNEAFEDFKKELAKSNPYNQGGDHAG